MKEKDTRKDTREVITDEELGELYKLAEKAKKAMEGLKAPLTDDEEEEMAMLLKKRVRNSPVFIVGSLAYMALDHEGTLMEYLIRHVTGDFGELNNEDVRLNFLALHGTYGRILSRYTPKTLPESIYIISYWDDDNLESPDYTYTSVLFTSDY